MPHETSTTHLEAQTIEAPGNHTFLREDELGNGQGPFKLQFFIGPQKPRVYTFDNTKPEMKGLNLVAYTRDL